MIKNVGNNANELIINKSIKLNLIHSNSSLKSD